jgi:hypothetical protein
MQIINTIITIGVAVLAVALITYAVGKTFISLPTFTTMAGGGTAASEGWYNIMGNISVNSQTAFSLLSISPLVLGVGLIISILIGAFAYMYMAQ